VPIVERTALDHSPEVRCGRGPAMAPYPVWLRTEDRLRWAAAAGVATVISATFERSGEPCPRFVAWATYGLFRSDIEIGAADPGVVSALARYVGVSPRELAER
jgi:hypothetical protein